MIVSSCHSDLYSVVFLLLILFVSISSVFFSSHSKLRVREHASGLYLKTCHFFLCDEWDFGVAIRKRITYSSYSYAMRKTCKPNDKWMTMKENCSRNYMKWSNVNSFDKHEAITIRMFYTKVNVNEGRIEIVKMFEWFRFDMEQIILKKFCPKTTTTESECGNDRWLKFIHLNEWMSEKLGTWWTKLRHIFFSFCILLLFRTEAHLRTFICKIFLYIDFQLWISIVMNYSHRSWQHFTNWTFFTMLSEKL